MLFSRLAEGEPNPLWRGVMSFSSFPVNQLFGKLTFSQALTTNEGEGGSVGRCLQKRFSHFFSSLAHQLLSLLNSLSSHAWEEPRGLWARIHGKGSVAAGLSFPPGLGSALRLPGFESQPCDHLTVC